MTVLSKGYLSFLNNVPLGFCGFTASFAIQQGVFVPCDRIMQRAHWKLQFQNNRIELLTHWDCVCDTWGLFLNESSSAYEYVLSISLENDPLKAKGTSGDGVLSREEELPGPLEH